MARATSVDSTWVGELDANVSIGGTSLVLDTTSGTNWPSGAGIFGVQVGDDPDDDAELIQVTRSGSTLTLDASTPTLTKAHTAGASIYLLLTALDHNNKASLDAGNNFTVQQKFTGGYTSGGAYYPDIIFDNSDLKTGIWGQSGELTFYIESGGIQTPAISVTPTYALFGVPLNISVPPVLSGSMQDGSLGDPYVPTLSEPGYIAVFPTTIGAATTITLPDPYNNFGLIYVVADHDGGSPTYNIDINCADDFALGTTVEGVATHSIVTAGRAEIFRANYNADYSNGNWKVIAKN